MNFAGKAIAFLFGIFLGWFWFVFFLLPLFYGVPRALAWALRGWVRWRMVGRYLLSAVIWFAGFVLLAVILTVTGFRPVLLESDSSLYGQFLGLSMNLLYTLFVREGRRSLRDDFLATASRNLTPAGETRMAMFIADQERGAEMGFLGRMFGFSSLPNWALQLPAHLRPAQQQIEKLEAVRQRIGASHEEFMGHILGHPATTRKLQHQVYNQLKAQYPHMTHQQLLAELVKSRWTTTVAHGHDLFRLSSYSTAERDRRIQEIVMRAGTVDALAQLFIQEDAPFDIGPAPGFEWARQEVTRILSE